MNSFNKNLGYIQDDLNLSFKNQHTVAEGVASQSYIVELNDDSRIFIKQGRNRNRLELETKALESIDFEKKPEIIGYNYSEPRYIALDYYEDNLSWNKDNFIENFAENLGSSLRNIHNLEPNISLPTFNRDLKSYRVKDNSHMNKKYNELIIETCSKLKDMDSDISFIHGDVNFGNIRLNEDGTINTYLDWESAGFEYSLFDVAKAESILDILCYYIDDYTKYELRKIFRDSYGLEKRNEYELWKLIRQYANYQKFKKYNGVHYNYGKESKESYELERQLNEIEEQYQLTKEAITKI